MSPNTGLFFVFVLFLIFLNRSRRKTEKKEQESKMEYWEREGQSNLTPAQDISGLDYIDFSGFSLPFALFPDDRLSQYEHQILALKDQKILNLNGMSNTDLKLRYGVSNLSRLMDYDQNFIVLVRTLNQWGHRLHELSHDREAAAVLRFAADTGSDIKATYALLLKLYQESGENAEIEKLKASAAKLNSIRRDTILSMLEQS